MTGAAPTASTPPAQAPAEAITLTDDDGSLPLFTGGPLAPGQRTVRCIVLTYAGGQSPADIGMRVQASGLLSDWVDVDISAGTVAARDCTGFQATRLVTVGTLAGLTLQTAASPVPVHTASPGVPFGVRIVTQLRADTPQALAGASAGGDFIWSAS